MQIPSFPPFQPPARPTKASTSVSVARSRETIPADRTSEANALADEPFTASSYEPIQQAMNNLPDSRADVIARGKALIADSTYPALMIINKLAAVFVTDAETSLVGDN